MILLFTALPVAERTHHHRSLSTSFRHLISIITAHLQVTIYFTLIYFNIRK